MPEENSVPAPEPVEDLHTVVIWRSDHGSAQAGTSPRSTREDWPPGASRFDLRCVPARRRCGEAPMSKPPTFIVDDPNRESPTPHMPGDAHPPAEEDLGGADICSPEPDPPTEDDKPLD